MTSIYWQVAGELAAALVAGGVIGYERSYHGRAAGFRTHALVCMAAAAAMMVSLAPVLAPGAFVGGDLRFDPTRLAQGVLTGIGFLGAGVIFKEGASVQGLTTAASVWATAAVGVLFGVGAMVPAALTAAGVLGALLVLRWVEIALPVRAYAWGVFRFRPEAAPDKAGLHAMLAQHGVSLRDLSYAQGPGATWLEFNGNMVADGHKAFDELALHLRSVAGLYEFEISRVSK